MAQLPSKERQAAKSLLNKIIAMMRAESPDIKPTNEQLLWGRAAVIVLRRSGFQFTDQEIKNIVTGDKSYDHYKGFYALDSVLHCIGSRYDIVEVLEDLQKGPPSAQI